LDPVFSGNGPGFLKRFLTQTVNISSYIDIQAAGEASNTPETTTSSSKHKISSVFPFFRAIGIFLDPDPERKRIQIFSTS
jgi:hypothetical protein